MGRLSVVVLFTPEIARQREFYEKTLGLEPVAAGERWLQFGTRDAALALRPVPAGEPSRIELGFDVRSLDERLSALKGLGVVPVGGVEESPECRIARVADPEGNVVQLVERRKPTAGGRWPRLSHAIVNALSFEACARFYHDVLGFRMADEREHWIQFDTGEASLTLHASRDADGLPLAPDQRVSFALMDEDLDAWADELRKRGVRFATSPSEEELGRFAEVEDADGWFVVLRGPSPEVPIEEELAADYADEDDSRIEQIRRSTDAEPGARPAFGSRKLSRKKVERVATRGFDAMQRSRESERSGFAPGSRSDRPAGPGGAGAPRPDRPFAPRSDRPFTPRPDRGPGASGPPRGDRPYSPSPGGAPRSDRPFTPRPDRGPGAGGPPRSDRPFTPRPDRGPGAGPRPDRPFPPRSDRPPGTGGPRPSGGPPRPSGPRPDRPSGPSSRPGGPPSRPGGPPRGPRRDDH